MAASGTSEGQYSLPPGMALVDSKHLEIMKVWYSLFVAIMDGAPSEPVQLIQLRKLRLLLRRQSRGLEDLAQVIAKKRGTETLDSGH